jgi:hypothetical protein
MAKIDCGLRIADCVVITLLPYFKSLENFNLIHYSLPDSRANLMRKL